MITTTIIMITTTTIIITIIIITITISIITITIIITYLILLILYLYDISLILSYLYYTYMIYQDDIISVIIRHDASIMSSSRGAEKGGGVFFDPGCSHRPKTPPPQEALGRAKFH